MPSSLASGQIAINEADGKLFYRNGAGAVTQLATGGTPSGSAGGDLTGTYPNPTIAPGAVVTADIADSAVTSAKIASVAAAKVTGLAAVATSGSASDLSGTLADARLSSTVTTALTNARTPTSHASSHSSGGADALTLAASQITSGTIADALLSANVPLLPDMLLRWSSQSSSVETTFRHEALTNTIPPSSGNVLLTFFTPLASITISQILMSSGAVASSGLTLARMGLYTVTESTATLVARTASDTTLFASTSTAYTRSLATAGGYPATYTLSAGTRYAVGVIQIGTTPAQLVGKFSQVSVASLTPRITAASFGQSDLANVSSLSANAAIVYARLS